MGILKRYEVKYIRDGVKANYPVKTACEICSVTEDLHFHHFNSLAELYNKWSLEKGIKVKDVSEMEVVRDAFISEFWEELVELGACLCKTHHEKLHRIYGKNPPLRTASKQAAWVVKQRERYLEKHGENI